MSDEPESDVAEGLIASLAEGGVPVDEGRFTLDPAAALAKLRSHQLGDFGDYLLLLVEAAWLAGQGREASGIHIALGAKTSAEFVGIELGAEVLPELFSAALSGVSRELEGEARTRARVLQLLGLAANAALALEPRQLRLSAGDAHGHASEVVVSPSGEVGISPSHEDTRPNTIRFEMDGGSGWQRSERELVHLLQRCQHASLPIWVDGERVSLGPTSELAEPAELELSTEDSGAAADSPPPKAPNRAEVEVAGRRLGVVGHTIDRRARPRLIFVNRAVAVEEPLDAALGLQAVVEVDMPLDLARKQLVEGPELDAIRAAVRAALGRLPAPLAPELPKRAPPIQMSTSTGLLLAVAIVSVFMLLVTSASSNRDLHERKPTPPPPMAEPKWKEPETHPFGDSHTECLMLPAGTTCATDANRFSNVDPQYRTQLLLRGCTFQHDAGACKALVEATRKYSAQEHLIGYALAMSCLTFAGPDCVEAVEHLRRGDIPDHETLKALFMMGDPVIEVDEADLLARACGAGIRDACP